MDILMKMGGIKGIIEWTWIIITIQKDQQSGKL